MLLKFHTTSIENVIPDRRPASFPISPKVDFGLVFVATAFLSPLSLKSLLGLSIGFILLLKAVVAFILQLVDL
jgi:hypothetical protein